MYSRYSCSMCSTFIQQRCSQNIVLPSYYTKYDIPLSRVLLITCNLSFSPTDREIMSTRAKSHAKATGNRLRHAPHSNLFYLLSALQWDSSSLSFPKPLLHYIRILCVLSHLSCDSVTASLRGRCNFQYLILPSNYK